VPEIFDFFIKMGTSEAETCPSEPRLSVFYIQGFDFEVNRGSFLAAHCSFFMQRFT